MTKKGDERRAITEERLWALFEKIKAEGRPTGPTAFAKEANISRPYLYAFEVLAAEVSKYGRQTQPKISKRGAGLSKADAIKRSIDDQVRREHTRWGEEIERLREQHERDHKAITELEQSKRAVEDELELYKRAYERLLLLAKESGVSPSELEGLQQRLLPLLRATG